MWIHRCCLCSVFVVTLSKFWQFGSIPVDIAFPNFILPSYFSGIYYTISVGKKNSSGINVLTWVCYTCQRNFNHQILSLVIHFYCIEYLWRSLTSNTTKGSKLRDWTFYKTQTLYLTIPLIFHACVEYHVFSEVCDPYTDFFFFSAVNTTPPVSCRNSQTSLSKGVLSMPFCCLSPQVTFGLIWLYLWSRILI